MKFLDEIGLAKLWGLITNKFATKDEDVSIDKLVAGVTNTKIPSSLLPSYVDDVLEYDNLSSFPEDGENGKIYVDLNTNKTYRWGGTAYTEISPSLALGTTSSTAYPGDYGAEAYERAATAYTHAVTNRGNAFSEEGQAGLYKIITNAEGHVTAATAVVKADITELGIPAQDTTYENATTETDGLMSAADKAKLDGISEGAGGSSGVSSVNNKTGDVTLNAADVGAVAKTGDTMTGRLVLGNTDTVKLRFLDTTGADAGFIHISDNTKQIAFVEQSNRNEYYRLPAPSTDEGTATVNYDILTTKGNYAMGGKLFMANTSGVYASDGTYLSYGFYDSANGKTRGSMMLSDANRWHVNVKETNSSYADRYLLPAPTSGKTADSWYDILTSKTPVTIAQGGTGATDKGTACKNLMVGVNIEPNALELHPTSTNAGYGGYIDFHYNMNESDYTSRIIEDEENYLNINAFDGGKIKLGRVTAGTWQGSAIGIAYGGTGATDVSNARKNLLITSLKTTDTPTIALLQGVQVSILDGTAAGTNDPTGGALLTAAYSNQRGFQIGAGYSVGSLKWRWIHGNATSDAGITGYSPWYTIYHSGNKPSTSDIGAAPTSHASTATTYGVSSASNYGHAMASSTTPKALGTAAVGSETAKFARGDHVHALPALTSCTGTLTVAKGGTGATSAANARKNLGVPTFTYTSSTKTLALTTT